MKTSIKTHSVQDAGTEQSRLWWYGFICVYTIILWLLALVLLRQNLGFHPHPMEFTFNLSTLLVSMLGAAAVGITLYLQFRTQRQQQEQTNKNFELAQYGYNLQIFTHIENLFLADKYLECRTSVWRFWSRYNNGDDDYRRATDNSLCELLRESMYDSWTDEGLKKFTKDRIGKDLKELFKLLRYFDIISNFTFDRSAAEAFYFYYIYYRRLISTIAELYTRTYEAERLGPRSHALLPMHGWSNLITRMDAKLSVHGLQVPGQVR